MIVKIENKEIEITKLPIGKYPEIIRLGKDIFSYFSKFDKIDNATVVAELPDLIEKNIPAFVKLLSIATPLTEEELQKQGLFEFVELTMAVIEINKYVDIYNRIKKVSARPEQTAIPNSAK